MPADIEVPHEPLHAALAAAATRFPTRAAIRFFGRTLTYRELEAATNRFANALLTRGVAPGDRVALLLPNCPQMVVAYLVEAAGRNCQGVARRLAVHGGSGSC